MKHFYLALFCCKKYFKKTKCKHQRITCTVLRTHLEKEKTIAVLSFKLVFPLVINQEE